MRPWSTLATALCLTALVPAPASHALASEVAFRVDATLTFLGVVDGKQRYRFDYTLENTGEPLGLTAFQVFFNSDPVTQEPSGDRATPVSHDSPAGWGEVTVMPKNAAGQWSINWDYDFVAPPGPLPPGQSLSGFSVVFDWNDPSTLPPVQHAQARNGASHSTSTDIVAHVGLTGSIVGTVSAGCLGDPQSAAGVTVTLLREAASFAATITGADGGFAFTGVPLGTYTVMVAPPAGFGTTVDHHIVSLQQVEQVVSVGFSLTCLLGNIEGTVIGSCDGRTAPLQGVTVDLFNASGEQEALVATTATSADGAFRFAGVALGDYHVSIVTPLGYAADANVKPVHLGEAGATVATGFALACQAIASEPRTIGYWKHQVNVHLTGRGSAQESLEDMLRYTDLLLVHFNQNIVNPVVIYVPASNIPGDRLHKLQQLLTVNRGGTLTDRAKQQLLALLLNVVSGKIAQTEVISPNGATVSQAITHANDLIQDSDPANDEAAKTIADLINNGQEVPDGMVPAATRIITYSRRPAVAAEPAGLALAPAFPNPSRGGQATLGFSLPRAGRVEMRILDVNGRLVRRLARGEFAAGTHQLAWDGSDETGRRVPPGVYFCRLATPEGARSRSIAVER